MRPLALSLMFFLCLVVVSGSAQQNTSGTASQVIPPNSKVFVSSMPDGFDQYIRAALDKKRVPVQVVEKREDADFEITGYSETQKAGVAKKLIMGSWHSRESASIKVADLKTGVVAFAYSYNNDNSAHGKKSSAESCAKHLKDKIESGK
ncbi:MAG: hypothetical protein ACXVZX_05900 [Terriglobales bacterium]